MRRICCFRWASKILKVFRFRGFACSWTPFSWLRAPPQQWHRLHRARGASAPSPTFTNGWAWAPACIDGQQTRNWPSRKCSPKRLIVGLLVEPKEWRARKDLKFNPHGYVGSPGNWIKTNDTRPSIGRPVANSWLPPWALTMCPPRILTWRCPVCYSKGLLREQRRRAIEARAPPPRQCGDYG